MTVTASTNIGNPVDTNKRYYFGLTGEDGANAIGGNFLLGYLIFTVGD